MPDQPTPPLSYRHPARLVLRALEVADSAFRTVPGQVFLATLAVLLLLATVTLRDAQVDPRFRDLAESSVQTTASLVQARVQLAGQDDIGPRLATVLHRAKLETAHVLRVELSDQTGLIRASSSPLRAGLRAPEGQLAEARAAARLGRSVAVSTYDRLTVREMQVRSRMGQAALVEQWWLLIYVDDVVSATVRQHMVNTVQLSTLVLLLTALIVATYVHLRLISPARRLGRHMHTLAHADVPKLLDLKDFPSELRPVAAGFNSGLDGLIAARKQLAWLDRDRFERLERLATIGRLSAMTAHEIRNPLAGIANAVAVIVREVPMGPEYRHVLEEVPDVN